VTRDGALGTLRIHALLDLLPFRRANRPPHIIAMAQPAPSGGVADIDPSTLLYPPNVMHNTSVQSVKFFAAALSGAVAGTLGWLNWYGFALFALTMIGTAGLLVTVNCKGQPSKYFRGGALELANPGQDNFVSFILAWTLFYGVFY